MAPRLDRLPSFETAQVIYVHEEGFVDLELPASPMWVDLRGLCHTSLDDEAGEAQDKAPRSPRTAHSTAEREALLQHLGGHRAGDSFDKKAKAGREPPQRCNMMPRRHLHNLQQPRAVY